MKEFCLVTGASSGIGYEFAKILIAHSYNLVLIDLNIKKLREIKQRFENQFNNEVIIMHKDLSKQEIANEIYTELEKSNIKIEILINNAGFGVFGFFESLEWEKQFKLIQLSVITTTHLTKLFLKNMIKQNYGKILNVSSIAAFQPGPLMSIYYATKAYLLSFTRAIANELRDTNITVTVLCPGMTKTNFQYSTGNEQPSFGRLCCSAERVAKYGFDAMIKGKTVAIPCYYNRIIANIHRLLSFNQATNLSRFLQERNRKQKQLQGSSNQV